MAPDESFVDACFDGELQRVQEAIAGTPLTTEGLDEGIAAATEQARPDVVAALLNAGASLSERVLNSLPGVGLTQNPMVIRQCLDQGLNPNLVLSGRCPLLGFMANPECARELLSRGADPNFTGPCGTHPMVSAMASSHAPDTVLLELLIAYGAKMDSDLLFDALASRLTHPELKLTFLLSKGLDTNTTSAEWGTPLHRAVYIVKSNLVKVLLDAGADPTTPSACTKFPNKTPLEVAKNLKSQDSREAILELFRSHAAQRSAQSKGHTRSGYSEVKLPDPTSPARYNEPSEGGTASHAAGILDDLMKAASTNQQTCI